jgi:N,N'-diacetyllegionaminate synthase
MQEILIGGRPVGAGRPCFVIAEAGVNHNGSLETAMRMVDVAADAHADAVKFQTFEAARLISPHARKAKYQAAATDPKESQLEMIRRLELPRDAHRPLMDYCRERGILFLSTPFEEGSADFLEGLGMEAVKIPSGEITNLPFLEHVARFGRPIILSTGMARLGEIEAALAAVYGQGLREIVLLQCVSSYPTSARDANLRAIETMRTAFGVPVGYSDHTMGNEVALAAVALGACVIEKHFTLDRSLPGPDQQASAEPHELKALVASIRNVEAALGHGRKEPAECERDTAEVARKSLLAAEDIPQGARLSREAVAILRPGTGLPPAMLPYVLGRVARRQIAAGELLELGAFD